MHTFKLTKKKHPYGSIFGIVILFIGFILVFSGIDTISKSTQDAQKESLEKALQRGIVQCYALEGHYPESLEDLIAHYGIVYDKDQFFVDYQPIAENIKPSVTVIELR